MLALVLGLGLGALWLVLELSGNGVAILLLLVAGVLVMRGVTGLWHARLPHRKAHRRSLRFEAVVFGLGSVALVAAGIAALFGLLGDQDSGDIAASVFAIVGGLVGIWFVATKADRLFGG